MAKNRIVKFEFDERALVDIETIKTQGHWPMSNTSECSSSPDFFCGPGGDSNLFKPLARPDRPGWYWFRWSRDDHDWQCIRVIEAAGRLYAIESARPGDEHDLENMSDGDWAGPIPMPPR